MKFFFSKLTSTVGLLLLALTKADNIYKSTKSSGNKSSGNKSGGNKSSSTVISSTESSATGTTESSEDLRNVLVTVVGDEGRRTAKTIARKVRVDLDDGSGIMGLTVTAAQEEALRRNPNVKMVEPDHDVYIMGESIDTKKNVRQLLEQTPYGITKVLQNDIAFFNNLGSPSQPFKVCVVDTGYSLGHPDLPQGSDVTGRDALGESWSQDLNNHGTHVAGTIAALGGNNIGITSVIPNNKGGMFQLVIGKGINGSGISSVSAIMDAVNACVDLGAKVINLSLGCLSCSTQQETDFYQNKFENQGNLIIAAAGNNGTSLKSYPASYGSVMSVASITESETRSSFSQFNDQVEISAPGSDILSTFAGNQYAIDSGTSMAAPHVTGVAGLLWSYFPTCTALQIRNVLDQTARDLGTSGCDTNFGYGIVQAKDAYNLLSAGSCGGNIGASNGIGGCSQLTSNPPTPTSTNAPTPIPTITAPINPPTPNPTQAPINPPTMAPAPLPTSPPVSGPSISVYVVIKTDNYPAETSFKVTDQNGIEVMSGGSYTAQLTEYTATATLPGNNVYQFTIYDTYGDGLCCVHGQGGYNLFVDGALIKAGGGFTNSETTTFPSVPGPVPTKPPLPLPTNSPVIGPSISVYVIIKTDNYPAETSFKVFNQNGVEVMSGGGYTAQLTEYTAATTLPGNNVYQFTIYDTAGDGLCCAFGDGGYNLFVDGFVIRAGGIFGSSENITFPTSSSGLVKVFQENQKPKYVKPTYEKSEVEKSISIAKDSNKGGE